MTTQPYQLRGNPVVDVQVPIVGNLVHDELGKEVLALHNERFKGKRDIEDTCEYTKDHPILFSNTPRILSYNQILRERFPGIHVLTPEEVVRCLEFLPERSATYADTDSIVVFPNQGPNEDLRQRVLELTGLKRFKIPRIVSGLGVEKADNDYGFTFIETDSLNAETAPFLQQDGRVIYNESKDKLVSADEGIYVYTSNAQSGLRGLYRSRNECLNSGIDDLLFSVGGGRVQIIQHPQGARDVN